MCFILTFFSANVCTLHQSYLPVFSISQMCQSFDAFKLSRSLKYTKMSQLFMLSCTLVQLKVLLEHFGLFFFENPRRFNKTLAYTHAINQISTMMLMGSPAEISLNRHGQQRSWRPTCTPIYFPHNTHMQVILSKKMAYSVSLLRGLTVLV